jgi:hypothetical protein
VSRDDAVKAAAEAMARRNAGFWPVEPLLSEIRTAEAAVAAAEPILRRQIAATLEAEYDRLAATWPHVGRSTYQEGYLDGLDAAEQTVTRIGDES